MTKRVRVENLNGGETGRYAGYTGCVLGKPHTGEPLGDDSVRFAMQGDGWIAKMFARRGEYFHVEVQP